MGFNAMDQPESELLIIDESSMIDTLLMDALLDAISSSARLVLVGDVDQLPSVGQGWYCESISELVAVVRLERIFRQTAVSDSILSGSGADPDASRITGSINLNRSRQSVLNPDGTGFEHREQWFKLMQQQNDYDKQVFNGDTGRIVFCDPKSREIHVQFDQGVIPYTAEEIDDLELAYAISIDNSQGNEYQLLSFH